MSKYMGPLGSNFWHVLFGFYMWDLLVYSTKNRFQRSPIFHLLSSWKRSFYNSLLIHFLSLLDSFPITFVCQKSWKMAVPPKLSGYVYFTKLCWGQILIQLHVCQNIWIFPPNAHPLVPISSTSIWSIFSCWLIWSFTFNYNFHTSWSQIGTFVNIYLVILNLY